MTPTYEWRTSSRSGSNGGQCVEVAVACEAIDTVLDKRSTLADPGAL